MAIPRVAITPKTYRGRRTRMTLEEFFEKTEGQFAEWVDGEVIYMTVNDPHRASLQWFGALMQHLAEAHDLGVVRTEPYSMKLDVRPSVREPDVMFISTENLERRTYSYLEGPCDVAVEIIGPGSRTRDRREKFFEYAKAGVREYWIIDHQRKRAEFFRLGEDGSYEAIPIEAGAFRSGIMQGFWLKMEWLWQEPLPKLMFVLREWGLV
jgi:Uma2 family endonuclease